MSAASVESARIIKMGHEADKAIDDLVVVEEPLEIRLVFQSNGEVREKNISVTMRTPGNDLELALGFLFTEGIINSYDDVENIFHCRNVKNKAEEGNVIKVELKPSIEIDLKKIERHFYTTSSCGVCGKSSIEATRSGNCNVLPVSNFIARAETLRTLSDKLRSAQMVFEYTGGLHAVGLFDTEGNLLMTREDVGRHNALDKLIGASLFKKMIPLNNYLLLVSGRASFELVQKAVAAGIPMLLAVGAPSSLAVKLAKEFNMTLVGFLKKNQFNVYSGKERIK